MTNKGNDMEHLGTKYMETEHLTLRPFQIDDDIYMYKNWANDDDVTRFLTWPTHSSVEVSRLVLSDWIPKYAKKNYYSWAIVLKSIKEPIGDISIVRQQDDIKMVHVGYCIGKYWWNQGFTSEALSALIDFFINEVGVNRIEARHDPRNPNSGKVMMKCGLKYEGTMRQADMNNQGICDYAIYGLVADEYKNILTQNKH